MVNKHKTETTFTKEQKEQQKTEPTPVPRLGVGPLSFTSSPKPYRDKTILNAYFSDARGLRLTKVLVWIVLFSLREGVNKKKLNFFNFP